MYTIKFNFEQKGLEPIILHNVDAGQSRLGCQCLLNDGEGEVEVTLPDQTQFLGE